MKVEFFSVVLSTMILAFSGIGATAFAEETTEKATSVDIETTEISETAKAAETTISSDAESEIAENTSVATETTTSEIPDYYDDDYYDTNGNATLIQSEQIIYNTEEMQFIAVTTKDGHVFYVLINYSAKDGEDNVFFLNNVRNTYGH